MYGSEFIRTLSSITDELIPSHCTLWLTAIDEDLLDMAEFCLRSKWCLGSFATAEFSDQTWGKGSGESGDVSR